MKMAKRQFRLPSYSMAYMAKYFGLTLKQSHEGLHMWDMIEGGTDKEKKEYLKKMVEYNKGDIVTTEELYLRLQPYFATVTNRSTMVGGPKWACPGCASINVKWQANKFTPAGTIHRIMYCNDSKEQFKIANRTFMDFMKKDIDKSWQ